MFICIGLSCIAGKCPVPYLSIQLNSFYDGSGLQSPSHDICICLGLLKGGMNGDFCINN